MKVRIKELAQEAKFIRLEENKIKKEKEYLKQKFPDAIEGLHYSDLCSDFWKLKSHRKVNVGEAARAAQLAYGFLRGIPYSEIESKRKPEKEYRFKSDIVPEVKRLVNKFGNLYSYMKESYDDEVEKWLNQLDIN
jgi:hypothetical protein